MKAGCYISLLSFAMLTAIGCETPSNPGRDAVHDVVKKHKQILDGENDPEKIIAAMKEIDVSGCPQDFRNVYVEHLGVWEKLTKSDEEQIELDSRRFTEQILSGQEETPEDINKNFEESVKLKAREAEIMSELGRSGSKVSKVASRYGADFPDIMYYRPSFNFPF